MFIVLRSKYEQVLEANRELAEENRNLRDNYGALMEDAKTNVRSLNKTREQLKAANACSDNFNQMIGDWSIEVLPGLKRVVGFMERIHEGWTCPDGISPWDE